MTSVEWRPILGHEGRYEVSETGSIRSLDYVGVDSSGRNFRRQGRVLRPLNKGKYQQVCLCTDKEKVYKPIGRTVAETFLDKPEPGKTIVKFRDGDQGNCSADNLYWAAPGGKKSDNLPIFDFTPEPWADKAMCKGRPIGAHDTNNLPSPNSNAHRRSARKLCEGCPVPGDCADYALRTKATGVVMAGVPIKSHSNIHIYEELRTIAAQHQRTQK